MSRIGNKSIVIPAGITVTYDNNVVTVSGPKGTLTQKIDKNVTVEIKDGSVSFIYTKKEANALQGLYRALVNNMIIGVKDGFSKKLLIAGVGYKASVSGNKLVLILGKSHQDEYIIPSDVQVTCTSATEIVVSGINKQRVGEVAAQIKKFRKVEPYHIYGIRYDDEVVIKKAGKTAGKGKK